MADILANLGVKRARLMINPRSASIGRRWAQRYW